MKTLKFCLLLILYFSTLQGQDNTLVLNQREQAIHAISSLRCHIQQLIDQEVQAALTLEEMDRLWKETQYSEYNDLLYQAKYYYERGSYEEALDYLNYVWGRLLSYPNFDKNPFLSKGMKNQMAAYLLPLDHPMKPTLDAIFSQFRVTTNLDTLCQSGFEIHYIKDSSFIIVASHPLVQNYLFKLYPDSERRTRLNRPSWQWLVDRCEGVKRIRKLIKKKKIKHFTVPDKWLYPLPPIAGMQHPIILLATDMNLVSKEETKEAWKTQITTEHLDELYTILSHGYGSNFLSSNVPYTKSGKFTFIDTEYPERNINLSKVKWYIASDLHSYWDNLIKNGGKK